MENQVDLAFYNDTAHMFEDYHLPEQQLSFTAYPIDSLRDCARDKERHPVVVLSNGKVAGFFVLHATQQYSGNKNALLLRAFSINDKDQGRGIATAALQRLYPFVRTHFPSVNELILAVNHRNSVAQHVYFKNGFRDTGRRAMGRAGEMFLFSKTFD